MPTLTDNQIRTSFSVETEWDKGFTGKLDLSNLGENLTDWTIEFESLFEIAPEQIWGAEIVSREGNLYTLKPVDYNQTINSQQSTSITFNANKIDGEILAPQKFQLGNTFELKSAENSQSDELQNLQSSNEVVPTVAEESQSNEADLDPHQIETNQSQVEQKILATSSAEAGIQTELGTTPQKDLPVNVDFDLISNWGDGFQGAISITNNSKGNIDTWNLEFDFPNQIENIWDANIKQNQNGSYSITSAAWNREISAGETVTFGFTGQDSVTIEPQNFQVDGFVFNSPSIYKSIYTYENPDLSPELNLNQPYQGRATFYDAANPAGGLGASGYDIPTQSELHKIVAINNIQWNGSNASGAFMQVSGPKQREGAEPIIVQVVDYLVERADGMDMSAEAFELVADPVDGTVNIDYQLIGPSDDYVTANGYRIGDGIVVETITGTNPYYAATRLNNHRYPIESVELIEDDGDLVELNRESDNRFVLEGNYPLSGAQDLLVTDIFGQELTLDDINITSSSAPDTVTGEQFALI